MSLGARCVDRIHLCVVKRRLSHNCHFFSVARTFIIYSVSNVQVCDTTRSTVITMLYVRALEMIHLMTGISLFKIVLRVFRPRGFLLCTTAPSHGRSSYDTKFPKSRCPDSWALRAGREDDAIFTGQIGGAQIRISRCLHSALKI